jgi:GDP-4-dehydro-6-deoxy-D-mannose reductase
VTRTIAFPVLHLDDSNAYNSMAKFQRAPMRIIVTGAAGFVAPYFIGALRKADPNAEIFACTRRQTGTNVGETEYPLDITDEAAVSGLIARIKPTHVMHLAGISAPPDASADPKAAWAANVFGTMNISRAILQRVPECVLMLAGSGEVYGSSANQHLPLDEDAVLRPTNEYAVTKAAADLAIGSLTGSGLRSIRFRPFNHVGPGQTEKYALSSFAAQIARIELNLQPSIIRVGDLNAERDFLDVRDVADAYVKAAMRSDQIPTGSIFNIASGIPLRILDLLNRLIKMSSANVSIEQDSKRVRPIEVPRICGDASKARAMLDWSPRYDFNQTIGDLLKDWRRVVRGEGGANSHHIS